MIEEVKEAVKDLQANIRRKLKTKPKLSVELVPKTCWFSNIRKHATSDQWDLLRRGTYSHYHHKCAVCGGVGPKWPVECHEMWRYSIKADRCVQKLRYLIALCPACHEVKHFGRAQVTGHADRAARHLMKVNGWSSKKAGWYLDQVFSIWRYRSVIEDWELDLSWVPKHFNFSIDL